MFLSILGSAGAQTMPDKLTLLNGDSMETSAWDGKVVLYVNVASQCGFTPQYDGLQTLWTEMKDDGLVIVASSATSSSRSRARARRFRASAASTTASTSRSWRSRT